MTVRHNACPNPACKNDVTGWGGGSTPTRSTGLTGFPDRTTGASYSSGTFLAGPTITVSAGQTWTISVYARSNAFNVNSGNIYAQWSSGSSSTGYTLTAGVVKRLSITATVPGGVTTMQIVLDGQNYGVSSGDFTELMYEQVASLDTYFDGDTTPGGSWDGTNGNSASTLSPGQTVILGQAVETDSALAIGRLKARTLGQPAETDTAQTLGARAKKRALGQALEFDTALKLGATVPLPEVSATLTPTGRRSALLTPTGRRSATLTRE